MGEQPKSNFQTLIDYTGGCIKWDSIFWDSLSLIGPTREIFGNLYKLGQYKMGQVNKRT